MSMFFPEYGSKRPRPNRAQRRAAAQEQARERRQATRAWARKVKGDRT